MTRPATRQYTSGMCEVTELSPHHYRVTSKPPIHSADVQAQGNGTWRVTVTTIEYSRSFVDASVDKALVRAGDLVSRAAGRVMQVFTPAQRYAMGQQQCPKAMGAQVCRQPAGVGTVWCEWHPGGKVRADD